MRLKLLLIFSAFYFPIFVYSQCGPGTPTLIVDLTGNPDSVWISPAISRNDNCCGTTPPDKCIKFVITLDPAAVGINFDLPQPGCGANPSGALYYQIGCGPPSPLGQPICLSGVGPHILTFCKPGNNANCYQITSIPPPIGGTDIAVNDGCTGDLLATGYIDSTVTWNSIYPGAPGDYNSYLSCTSGCVDPTVTAQAGYPPYVDYEICGIPAALCALTTICDTVRVTFNSTLLVTIIPTVPTICFGATSITLTANGSGGTPPYTYLWNNINTAQSINVGAGTYNVMVSDTSGCPPAYASVTVTSFSVAITANAGPDQTICSQNPTTTLSGSVTGASGGIWSGGAGIFSPNNTTLNAAYTPTAAEIAGGCINLILTTTGNGTCPADSDTVMICYQGFTGVVSVIPVNVSCYGGNNGSATVTITGGTSPYTYFWNTVPAQTTSTASNLTAGTYSVTITNGIGCTFTTSVIITQPPPLAINSSVTNVSCFGGNNGTVVANATGGTPAYTYLWNPGGQTTASATNFSAGIYTLTVTDNNGCQITSVYTIIQPPQLLVSLSAVNVSCFSGSNGSINSTVTGGTPLYTYSWTPMSATSPNVSGVPAGTYTLTVTDSKGCTKTATITITQPTALTASVTTTNETCNYLNNGTAAANVSGGTPTYTYNWQPGGQTSSAVSNLSAGTTYTLTVTDINGCTTTVLVTITQPPALAINFMNQTNVSCFGGNNGAVTANVTGGTPAYTYLWNPGGQTTVNASNLQAGTYTLTVTDNNGCQVQNIITITQPLTALSVTATATAVSCGGGTNGTATVAAAGGSGSYTYSWNPTAATTATATGLLAGTYTVTVVDANGCIATNIVTVTQPPLINLTTSTVNAACAASNGQASVTVSGGVSPYTYLWNPTGQTTSTASGLFSGSYTVVVTDANGCSASAVGNIGNNAGPTATITSTTNVSCYGGTNGFATATASGGTLPYTYVWNTTPPQSTSTATGLPAGNYVVTVTDGTGCQSLASITITQPTPIVIVINITSNSINCFGGNNGSASASASGGTPGYTYSWSPSGGTGSTVTGLTAGNYTVTVTDANVCVQTATFVINQPAPLTSTIVASSNVSCFGGSNGTATVSVSGGTPFYNYSWAPFGGNGSTAVNLSAGTYTVNIVDANGCTQSATVTITQPAQALTASGTTSSVNCFGGSNGSATVNPIGGTPGYTYQWSNGQTTSSVTGLTAGTYNVLITDANGCQTNVTLIISQPSSAVSGTLATVNPSCGLSNGSISSQISGGTGPYAYLWTPGSSTSASISSVAPGNYTLQVTDAAGCIATLTVTLTNIPGPSAVVSSVNNVSCFGGNNGTATVTISQGTAPYTYSWSPYGGNSTSAISLIAGTYTVNVTDALGCTTSATVIITEPTPVNVSVSSVTPVSCYGGTNGTAAVAVAGGSPAYTYLWSNGQTTSSAVNLSAGTYTVNVLDQNNCSASITININQPSSALSSSISSAVNPSCYAGSGSATVMASGGTIPYSYSWSTSPVQVGSTSTNLSAGSYTVTTIDANGCTAISTVTITQPTQVITTASPNDTICLGQTTLTATASGGAGNYYYAWYPVGVINSGTLTITPSTSTTYIVIAYDQNGCVGTPDTVSAIVYSLTPANVQVIAYSPICPGQSSVVYVQVTSSTGPVTYLWNNGDTNAAIIVSPTQPTTYIVTVTNYCGDTITDSVQIILNPPPSMSLTSDTNTSCVPAVIQFFDNSVSGNPLDPITSWYWSFGDGNYSTASDPIHTYTQPGTYTVVLTVATTGGCSNNTGSAPLIIYAIPSPTANFTTTPSVTPLNNQTINFTNTGSTGVGITYFWDFGDGATSIAMNPQHHFPTNGFYTVTLITTNQYGCTDTFRIQTTGTGDITFPNAFTPNANGPNGGGYNPFNLDNDVFFPFASGIEEFHMQIFNRWGELIFETDDIKIGWDGYYREKLCQQDVYVWKAYAKFIDERTVNKTGDVTLLR